MSEKLLLATITLFFALAHGPVSAQDRYRIDPEHTYSMFEYEHWGLSLQRGRFDNNSGNITLDRSANSGIVDIEIDAASINTGNALFNTVLRSKEFFDVVDYPKIRFTSSSMQFNTDGLAKVEGVLTIKNISRPIVLEIARFNCRYMPLYGKQACGANGSAKLLRSDYALGRYVPFVSDAVTLYISVEAIKEGSSAPNNVEQ